MTKQIITVPDLGGADEVEVIEICVAVGDVIKQDDSLLVLESDKASMEVPSPQAGKVLKILVKEGDKLKQGAPIFELEAESSVEPVAEVKAPEPVVAAVETPKPVAAVAAKSQSANEMINVPDIGTPDAVQVIEVCVKVGDTVKEGDSLVVLESDKASMEVPSPKAGKVTAIKTQEGASLKQGDAILELMVESVAELPEEKPMPTPTQDAKQVMTEPQQVREQNVPVTGMTENRPTGEVYAGPAVRKMAREIGLDLVLVPGSGPRGRIQKEDVKSFIKDALKNKLPASAGAANASSGMGIPPIPEIDFSQFGEVRVEALTKMHKVTAANMHRSWLNVPHVTQFDEADITDLEEFRASIKAEAEKSGAKLTPLPFIIKACVAALKANPKFNASLHANGDDMVYKNYFHIGIAVDTPAGLMVPVIRDADKKSLYELAIESNELAQKAKERKLKPAEMQGGCFTISSLGNMGGTGFTPIVNAPEVGILGVSKLDIKPRWNGKEFEPRKMLPLCLSYDHRAVNGADAGKFMVFLNNALSDIRRLVL